MLELSGCIIKNDRDEILLLWKIKENHYELPGGKVEINETLEDTAKRECKEELDVDVKIIKYLGYNDFTINNKVLRSHKFLAKIKKDQKPKINEPEKFNKLFWLPIKDYSKYPCAPNVIDFCKSYLNDYIERIYFLKSHSL